MEEYLKNKEEKMKSIKYGEDVLHINHIGSIVSHEDFEKIEEKLKQVDIQLSTYDTNGGMSMSVDEFMFHVFMMLPQNIIADTLTGTLSELAKEAIKHIAIIIWKKCKGQSIKRFRGKELEDVPIKQGIEIRSDSKGNFKFKIEGNWSEELVKYTVEESFEFLKSQGDNPKSSYIVRFNKKKKVWEKFNMVDEIRKQREKQKKKCLVLK